MAHISLARDIIARLDMETKSICCALETATQVPLSCMSSADLHCLAVCGSSDMKERKISTTECHDLECIETLQPQIGLLLQA